jgi:hypothetical protein
MMLDVILSSSDGIPVILRLCLCIKSLFELKDMFYTQVQHFFQC